MSTAFRSGVILVVLIGGAAACARERRDVTVPNPDRLSQPTRLTELQAGAPSAAPAIDSPFRNNAYGLSEGKRLYAAYNCVGCHANGGGAIGPALMDHRWIYGNRPEQIYTTIVEGRPNGMPAFGGRIPEQQLWQIVAYVESLSGNVSKAAAPGRNDDKASATPENRRDRQPAIQTGHR